MLYEPYLKKLCVQSQDFSNLCSMDIILYGAGSLGRLAMETLKYMGIKPKAIVDKSKSGMLMGVDIMRIDSVSKNDRENCLFLICISTISYNEVMRELEHEGVKYALHYYTYAFIKNPSVLGNGWLLYDNDYCYKKANEICELLQKDEKSIAHYLTFLYWKRYNEEKIVEGHYIDSGKKYFDCDCFPVLSNSESFLDVGCYKGAIIQKFLDATNELYQSIIGIEPITDFYNETIIRFKNTRNITILNCAISDSKGIGKINSQIGMACHLDINGMTNIDIKTIDSLGISPTIIKLHVEGKEYNCLVGGAKTITEQRPVLMVVADHNSDGWYVIPKFVDQLENYSLFFRLHDYCGNSAVWYFIPNERVD